MLNWTHVDIITEQDVIDMTGEFFADEANILAAGFDTETTGLHIIYDRPFLYQFGWCTADHGHTYAVDLELHPTLAQRTITIWQVYASRTPIYLGHNVKFDLHMCENIKIPYRFPNISDTMSWIRLGSDAIPERKGGAPLGLKKFATRYISKDAADLDKAVQEERTAISSALNNKLKKRLGWTKKKIDEFFKDKLNTADDLPPRERAAYSEWHSLDLPLWLQGKIKAAVTSEDIPYNKVNRKTLTKYGHFDIVWLLETFLLMHKVVTVRGNLEAIKIENDSIYPLMRMERIGFKTDYNYLITAQQKMKVYIRERRKDLCTLAGAQIKSSQNEVILNILKTKFNLDVTTTESEALSRIHSDLKHEDAGHPAVAFIETLQELRTLEKWYSTYIMRFIANFKEEDGKLYTTINPSGTVSGRVTSDFQQFPKDAIVTIDGEELFEPRKMVLAEDGDFDSIVYLDYSQIELRLQAFYTILVDAADLNLCRAYMPYKCHTWVGDEAHQSKKQYDYTDLWCKQHAYDWAWYYDEEPDKRWKPLDVHGATTKIAFQIDETDEHFHALRYKGKRVNFAKNYGAQFSKIKEMFPEYDDDTIHRIDDAYYIAFPGVKAYHQYCYNMANCKPYLSNMFGVKYYNASGHNLINMLVQGTGAYFLKLKVIAVDKYLRDNNYKSVMMMQIHDELQFKHHKDDPIEIFFEIKKIMEEWDETYVPIVADMEVATTTWANKYEVNSLEEYYGTKN